jgi:hypothetical protein
MSGVVKDRRYRKASTECNKLVALQWPRHISEEDCMWAIQAVTCQHMEDCGYNYQTIMYLCTILV